MNISPMFANTHRVFPGFESVVQTDTGLGFIILFTGQSNLDDETTNFNYTLLSLDQTIEPYAVDVATDITGNVVEVNGGCKLTPDEAMALRKEEMHVAEFWIIQNTDS